jgi:hypothetical protein
MLLVKETIGLGRPGGLLGKGDEFWVNWKRVSSVKMVRVLGGICTRHFSQ